MESPDASIELSSQFPDNDVTNDIQDLKETVNADTGTAIQLIKITKVHKNTEIQLVQSTMNRILELTENRPIAPICICGPSREGKSFLCSNLIRCLLAAESGNLNSWMDYGNPRKPLFPRFEFKNSSNPVTEGIWIWDRPFIIKQENGEEVAVLVIDTQGTYDEFTDDKDMVSIVGLSLLMSSHLVFNFSKTLREDILGSLETYISYGELVQSASKTTTPFQNLTFLIRDFAFGEEYEFGAEGGHKFIQDKLQIKANQSKAAERVRSKISTCFEKVTGFVMPHPGKNIDKANYDGNIADLDVEFVQALEDLVTALVTENLKVKNIFGKTVLASEWAEYFRQHVEAYNSSTVPSPVSVWEATASVADRRAVDKAFSKYISHIETALMLSEYLAKPKFDAVNDLAIKLAARSLENSQHFGNIETLKISLENAILEKQILYQTRNYERRAQVLEKTKRTAREKFDLLILASVPFAEGNVYTDEQIFQNTKTAIEKALEYPTIVTADEEPDVQAQILDKIKTKLDNSAMTLKIELKNNKDRAEKNLQQKITKFVTKYKTDLVQMSKSDEITEGSESFLRQHFNQCCNTMLADLAASSKFGPQSPEYAKFKAKLTNKLSRLHADAVIFVKTHLEKESNEMKQNAKKNLAAALNCYAACMDRDLSQEMFDSAKSHLEALKQAHLLLDPVVKTLNTEIKSQVLFNFEEKINERYKLHKDHVAIKLDTVKLQDEQQRLFEAQKSFDKKMWEQEIRLVEQERLNQARFEEQVVFQEKQNKFYLKELQEMERKHAEQIPVLTHQIHTCTGTADFKDCKYCRDKNPFKLIFAKKLHPN